MMVGLTLYSPINEQVKILVASANMTTSSTTALSFMPVLFASTVLLVGATIIINGFRDIFSDGAGMDSDNEDDEPEDVDGDGEISEDEETIHGLMKGQESEVAAAEIEELKSKSEEKPKKKQIPKRESNDLKVNIADVDYHGTTQIAKEKDNYLDTFNDDKKNKGEKFIKKGKFD